MNEDQAHPSFEALFTACRSSAIHLEMRDEYTPNDPVFLDWRAGVPVDPADRWREWYELMKKTTARGVRIRRARIVSEPVTDFVRYEYELTAGLNLAAGEDVRWLPRRQASDLALPGNDFWVFDDRLVRFHHFTGVGDMDGDDLTEDEAVVRLCTSAFEAVWRRAVPHDRYTIT